MAGRITEGFRAILELKWSDFRKLEVDPNQSNFNSVITAFVRACLKGNLRAIQVALDRVDGPIANEIEVEYPQFYTLYPNATLVADDSKIIDIVEFEPDHNRDVIVIPAEPEELPTGSLRVVLDKMMDSPKQTVTNIIGWVGLVDNGDTSMGDPRVKSVIIAGMMQLVYSGRVNAIFEIMNQIDGKIHEKYKILGSDVFIYNYGTIAPAGSVKNSDGIYQITADNTTNAWVARLEESNGRKKNR